MRVVHVPYAFYPDAVGGTEVYVDALTRELADLSVESVVVAPGVRNASYAHAGVPVHRFGVSNSNGDLRAQYGSGDSAAASAFGSILDAERPSLVHLHAFTGLLSGGLVREVKHRGLPLVFTYHTPAVSCQRETLLRWGTEICDGVLRTDTCAACTLHGLGLPRELSQLFGAIPPSFGSVTGAIGIPGRAQTVLRMTELTKLRHSVIRYVLSEADRVVAVCDWASSLLQRNGIPSAKIVVSRHGLSVQPQLPLRTAQIPPIGPPRIAFLGRLDAAKGAALLIRAVGALPAAAIQLDIFGVSQGASGAHQHRELQKLAAGDARIRFMDAIPHDQVVALLRDYAALAVPSQCLETGPMVVLEAFAAGLPVIGSRLGGIAELVTDDSDGLLVESGSVAMWTATLERILKEPTLLARLRTGVRPPRLMSDVAAEMYALYASVLSGEQLRQTEQRSPGILEKPLGHQQTTQANERI